jgi:hypothetical protein
MTPPHFDIYVIISPLKRTWLFIGTNLNSLYPRIICSKFDWIWPAGSGEDFLKDFSVFFLFRYYLPLKRDNPLHLNRLEFLPPKDDLCQVWLKLAKWFWRTRFLNYPTPFLWFSPLRRDLALYLNKQEFPLPKDDVYARIPFTQRWCVLCTKFDWIWPAGSGEDL